MDTDTILSFNSNFSDLKITMIKGDDLTKHKLNGIHAVGRGAIADKQPYFINSTMEIPMITIMISYV